MIPNCELMYGYVSCYVHADNTRDVGAIHKFAYINITQYILLRITISNKGANIPRSSGEEYFHFHASYLRVGPRIVSEINAFVAHMYLTSPFSSGIVSLSTYSYVV